MTTYKPTEEQENIVELFKTNNKVKVIARSGSGKTSSLIHLTKCNPEQNFLYLAFNKSMAVEAASKMPSNVEVMTTHALAYREFGRDLAHKLTRPAGRYINVAGTGREIAIYYGLQAYKASKDKEISRAFLGLIVRDTVAKFERGAELELSFEHIPTYRIKDIQERFNVIISEKSILGKELLKVSKLLWKDRIDEDSIVMASHDTYLKMFHLSKPDFKGWDVVLLDEAQDSTPLIIDMLSNVDKLIGVGDDNQAIYGWRGAINALDSLEAPSAFLTKSFRFGEKVAKIASSIIGAPLYGNEVIDTKVGEIDYKSPYTIIYRKNLSLIEDAVDLISQGEKVFLNIDTRDFVSLINSARALIDGKKAKVKHDLIVPYTTWGDLVSDSKNNNELKRIVKIINDGREDQILEMLGKASITPEGCNVVLTTAHKSKGLEYNQVVLADDYELFDQKGGITKDQQEINLAYVAATRCKYNLKLSDVFVDFLALKGLNLK